jgi:hypothetical protein
MSEELRVPSATSSHHIKIHQRTSCFVVPSLSDKWLVSLQSYSSCSSWFDRLLKGGGVDNHSVIYLSQRPRGGKGRGKLARRIGLVFIVGVQMRPKMINMHSCPRHFVQGALKVGRAIDSVVTCMQLMFWVFSCRYSCSILRYSTKLLWPWNGRYRSGRSIGPRLYLATLPWALEVTQKLPRLMVMLDYLFRYSYRRCCHFCSSTGVGGIPARGCNRIWMVQGWSEKIPVCISVHRPRSYSLCPSTHEWRAVALDHSCLHARSPEHIGDDDGWSRFLYLLAKLRRIRASPRGWLCIKNAHRSPIEYDSIGIIAALYPWSIRHHKRSYIRIARASLSLPESESRPAFSNRPTQRYRGAGCVQY